MEVIIILFEVRRTSCWTDEYPYEKCIPIKLTRVETRTLKTPEEFDAKFSKREGKWLEVGSNHRVDKRGFITRDRDEKDTYGIEINSLEEDIIKCHMFPSNTIIPRYLESWIVNFVDKTVATYEFSKSFQYKFRYLTNFYLILLFNFLK